ncbi:Uncharacterised protein [Burkholderia pseudomallei]|nr:Uncharacterised protein [Burkholderia pseudomallei]VCF17989.1 Uncharacterised protein [Burkholderia pseudomallei]
MRQIVRAPRERDRARRVLLLRIERMQAHDVVGDVLQRADDRLVVVLDRLVVARRRDAQLRAQPAALEDRQRERGAGRPAAVHRAQERRERRADREAAERRDQVDVRIERGLRDVDAARLRVDHPARGDDVRPAAEQLGGQRGRQGGVRVERELRPRERGARARPLARERGELVTAELDRLFIRVDLPRIIGQRRFGLAYLELRADARAQALARQFGERVLALVGRVRDVEERVVLREIDVRAHDVRLELELRGTRVGRAGARRVERALGVVLVLAPQIEVVRQAQRARVVPRVGVRERARAVIDVVRPVLAHQRQVAVQLRQLLGVRDARERLRLAHAGLRGGERRVAGERRGDPRIELRIAIRAPPVGRGPAGVALGRRDRRARIERRRIDLLVLRCNIAHACASGHY